MSSGTPPRRRVVLSTFPEEEAPAGGGDAGMQFVLGAAPADHIHGGHDQGLGPLPDEAVGHAAPSHRWSSIMLPSGSVT